MRASTRKSYSSSHSPMCSFERHYYPHAIFLAPVASPARLVLESPLLFWTIVLIASQNHEKHNHLYEDLFVPHQGLLTSVLNNAIRSLGTVHALLLLCLWPIPRRRMLLDPSWTYIAIAVNGCTALNCHRPLPRRPNVPKWVDLCRGTDAKIQSLTWLACFSIGTRCVSCFIYVARSNSESRIATFLGFMPPISSPNQLKFVRKAIDQLDDSLSHEHRASLAIDEIVCHYNIALEAIEDAAAYLPLTDVFDDNLDAVKQTHRVHWSSELDVHLQTAKLYLYAASAILPLQSNSSRDAETHITRQTLSLRGFNAATTLISTLKALAVSPPGCSSPSKLSFFPKPFFTGLFFSAVFLFRLIVFFQPTSHAQTARAIQGMADAQFVFQLLPHHRDHARGAKLISKLVEKAESRDASTSHFLSGELVVTNRLGASLLWDTFARIHVGAQNNGDGKAIKGASLVGHDTLPLWPEMKSSAENDQLLLNGGMATASEHEAESWAFWNGNLDDFAFGFDEQVPWQV